MILSSLC